MTDKITPERLVEVAIDLFGRNGLDGVTTRAIAEAAGARQSAISYHFGTKERLYLACAERIAMKIRAEIGPLTANAKNWSDPLEASHQIEAILGGLVTIMMQDQIAPMSRFILREQMNPSPAFTVLYEGALQHLIEPMSAMMSFIANGHIDSEELRVRCFALLGQVFSLRYARAALLRVAGWDQTSSRETGIARRVVISHTRAILAELTSGPSR